MSEYVLLTVPESTRSSMTRTRKVVSMAKKTRSLILIIAAWAITLITLIYLAATLTASETIVWTLAFFLALCAAVGIGCQISPVRREGGEY